MIERLTPAAAERLARLALDGIHREYPHHLQHLLLSNADAATPRALHPAFFGCFDWHSAVHSHWLLARLLNVLPGLALRDEIIAALGQSFEPAKLAAEAAYLAHPERRSFERPYGLAWLAKLAAEVAVARAPAARDWYDAMAPLAAAGRTNLERWLPRLRQPVRSGTHAQTAFALALLLDAAGATEDDGLAALVRAHSLRLYGADAGASLAFEPSGEDFLSPCLMEAELMGRVLSGSEYADWLCRFLPGLPTGPEPGWLLCGTVDDEADGKLVHLHGLNLSRAWNLRGIAAALPAEDPRARALCAAAERHAAVGLEAALAGAHYAGSHWLPTFAVYLLTERSSAL